MQLPPPSLLNSSLRQVQMPNNQFQTLLTLHRYCRFDCSRRGRIATSLCGSPTGSSDWPSRGRGSSTNSACCRCENSMNKEEKKNSVLIKLINIDKKLSCACIIHDKMQCAFCINIRKNLKYFIKGICRTSSSPINCCNMA